MTQNYKKAFKCSKCPGNNGEGGCPVWLELVGADPETGKPDVKKGCGHALMPQLLVIAVSAMDTNTVAENGTRNVMSEGFKKLIDILNNFPHHKVVESAINAVDRQRLNHDPSS